MMSRSLPAVLIALAAALVVGSGCTSGDSEEGRRGGGGSDRGPLEGPVNPNDDGLPAANITEMEDIIRLRFEAFRSANPLYTQNASPLVEDPRVSPILGNKARLHWSAIHHTGFLASIPTYTTSLETNSSAFGGFLAPGHRWKINCPPPPPGLPRWSVNNIETAFNLPLATDTANPTGLTVPIFPRTIPTTLTQATPKNRYIIRTWNTHIGGDVASGGEVESIAGNISATGTPGADGVHEYYIRQPFIPNSGGSRIQTAFLNRYGRLGMIRNQHDYWGFGSISEARALDLNVLLEEDGRFLPATLADTPPPRSLFAGTLAYRVSATRPAFRPSFWPGARSDSPGNGPITYGWSYDPETGAATGVVIHAAGILPICQIDINVSFDPLDDQNAPWQPRIENNRVVAATSRGTYPDGVLIDNDPAKPFYPVTYDFYGACYATVSLNPNRTVIGNFYHDNAYQANEAFIVPRLKSYFNGAMPSGTYRVEIVAWQVQPPCVNTLPPTESAVTQVRYFHVWNEPGFFRP
ncbi:MAG TPA: hypothetical protein VEL07_22260 [Planctomycetota bacterium]|nr:hypothetical protein [Planctomycetota bacterium]